MIKLNKKRMVSFAIAFAVIINLILPSNIIFAKEKIQKTEITIFHTNDTHGRVKGNNKVIGIDRIASIKKAKKDSLLVDAGDTFHGLPFATINKGEDIVKLMQETGYDLMVPGNHDFNYGYTRLLELAEIAKSGDKPFELISSNVFKSGKNILKSNFIKDVNGIKIGFFGLTTEETSYKTNPNNVKGIEFRNTIDVAKNQVKELKNKGADVIVALAHVGTDKSSEITTEDIAENVKGIDVIVDGHSHTRFENGFLGENNTLIVSTGEYEENLGELTLTIDNSTKKLVKKEGRLIGIEEASKYAPDENVKNKIDEIDAAQDSILSKKLGETNNYLEGAREKVRTSETNLGNLITDAMLDETKAEVAISNGGGIRASIDKGVITKGDIIAVLPFGNFTITKKLKGFEIKDVLEHGVKDYPATAGQFTHVSGIKFKFDPEKKALNRVHSIKINNEPIDMNKEYLVATNDFIAAGGDDYPHFKNKKIENEFGALDETLESYIKKLGVVNYNVEGRIIMEKMQETKPEEKPENKPEKPEDQIKPEVKPEKLNEVPIIHAKDIEINVGDRFDPLKGVTATDKEDGDLTDKIKVLKNTVNINKSSEYVVLYSVTDKNGATTKKEIKVIVKEINNEVPATGKEEGMIFLTLGIILTIIGLVMLNKKRKSEVN